MADRTHFACRDRSVRWLVHRLARFGEAHPEIDLRVNASAHQFDFARRTSISPFATVTEPRLASTLPVCVRRSFFRCAVDASQGARSAAQTFGSSIVAQVAKISFASMRARAYRHADGAINALIGRACGPGLLALFLGLPLALRWARRLLKTELSCSSELLLLLCEYRRAKTHRDGKAGCHYQSPHREPHCLLGSILLPARRVG